MEITIKIQGLETITEAINNLAKAIIEKKLKGDEIEHLQDVTNPEKKEPVLQTYKQPEQMPQQFEVSKQTQMQSENLTQPYTAPQQQVRVFASATNPQPPLQNGVSPVTAAAPIQQTMQQQPVQQTMQQQVPVTYVAETYTQDQIAQALTRLLDSKGQQVVMQVLGQFGAQYLTQIPTEHYAALAQAIKAAGGTI